MTEVLKDGKGGVRKEGKGEYRGIDGGDKVGWGKEEKKEGK